MTQRGSTRSAALARLLADVPPRSRSPAHRTAPHRARLADGIRFKRHVSVIKTLFFLELLASHGPLAVADFLPTSLKYLEEVAAYYCGGVDSDVDAEAFEPLFTKTCAFIDAIKCEGGYQRGEGAAPTTDKAIADCIIATERTVSEILATLRAKGQPAAMLGEEGKPEDREQELVAMVSGAASPRWRALRPRMPPQPPFPPSPRSSKVIPTVASRDA